MLAPPHILKKTNLAEHCEVGCLLCEGVKKGERESKHTISSPTSTIIRRRRTRIVMTPDECAGSRDVAEVVARAVVALLAYGFAGKGEGEEGE